MLIAVPPRLLQRPVNQFAFGFALIPLYDVLCDLTGFGNQKLLVENRETTTGASARAPRMNGKDRNRSITNEMTQIT